MKRGRRLTVGILMGGPSAEDYLSRRSAEVVFNAMRGPRYDLIVLDWLRDDRVNQFRLNSFTATDSCHASLVDCLTRLRADIIFNATHGEYENSGQLQGLFNLLRVPFTGNGLQSSVIGMDKILSKKFFQSLGINTPRYVVFDRVRLRQKDALLGEEDQHLLEVFEYPLIVKPAKGGSSVDMAVVRTEQELRDCVVHLFNARNRSVVFAEEFKKGKDYSVGVFGSTSVGDLQVLPVAEILYNGEFFDAKTKFEDTYRVCFDHALPSALTAKLEKTAGLIHSGFRFEGFSRTDFIVTENEVFVLEVNTHPGFSNYSIVPNMLKRAGVSLAEAIDKLIEWGLQPRSLSEEGI